MTFGWLVTATIAVLVSTPTPTLPQDLPPTEPILRIETGMHVATISNISVSTDGRLLATASDDKTVRLWSLPEGKLLHILRGPSGESDEGQVWSVAVSPDGSTVAAGGMYKSGRIFIYDTSSGKMLHSLRMRAQTSAEMQFSADGKRLAAGGELGVHVWNTESWATEGTMSDCPNPYGLAFDDSGRLAVSATGDGQICLYSHDLKLISKIKTPSGELPYRMAFTPDGRRLAVGYHDRQGIDVFDGRALQYLFTVKEGFLAAAWSRDGQILWTVSGGKGDGTSTISRWGGGGQGLKEDIATLPIEGLLSVRPFGESGLAFGSYGPTFGVIDDKGKLQVLKSGEQADMHEKVGRSFAVSKDGHRVRFGLEAGDRDPWLFDLDSFSLRRSPGSPDELKPADTVSLNVEGWRSSHGAYPRLNGKILPEVPGYANVHFFSLAIAPDAKSFVLGTEWHLAKYSSSGELIWSQRGPGWSTGVNIPPDGKVVVAAHDDGTIRWYRLSDGAQILALFISAKTREWVLWTRQGYYASSVNGDQMIGWHLNKGWEQAGEFVTAARLKKHLYRPDIVKRAFELADADAAVREAGLSGFKLVDLASHAPPEFRIIDPGDKSHSDRSPVAVKLEVSETNDPITGFDIKVNGRQVTPRDVRDIPQPTKNVETRTLNIPMQKGENHIQVVARNGVGETVQDLLVYLDREGVLDKKGRLFIVAVGVDKYTKLGDRYTLRYAGADARLMVDTLTNKAGPLHTGVVSKLLISDGDTPPTKANIEDALALFRDASPEDTVILFIASHGVNDGADYLMVPEDAERNDVGRWRPSSVVSWNVLQKALQDAQGNRIMFVDTCHSSGAYNSRLVKDAADANIVVFSATDKDTEAQETSKLGHGVFTYALSQGLKGEADSRKRGSVNILALGDYVSEEVKRMTNDEQEPVFSGAGVKNFVLATP